MAKADAMTTANAIPPMTLAFIRLPPSVRRDCSTADDVSFVVASGCSVFDCVWSDPALRGRPKGLHYDRPAEAGRYGRSSDRGCAWPVRYSPLAAPRAATTAPTITPFHLGIVIAPVLTMTVHSPAMATLQLRPGIGRATADVYARTAMAIPATASSALTSSLRVESRNVAASNHTPRAQFIQLNVFIGKTPPILHDCMRTANDCHNNRGLLACRCIQNEPGGDVIMRAPVLALGVVG